MKINTQPDIHELVIIASIFVIKGDKILMIRRSDKKIYMPGFVQPIGGKVDLDEDPLSAARRELMEEAHIEVDDIKLKAIVTEVKSKRDDSYKTNWQIFHFVGQYDKAADPSGFTDEGELIWLTLEEIKRDKVADSILFIIDSIVKIDASLIFAKYIYGENNQITEKFIEII